MDAGLSTMSEGQLGPTRPKYSGPHTSTLDLCDGLRFVLCERVPALGCGAL